MIVTCVLRSGKEYNDAHVYNLRDMCKDFLPEHNFLCLTDTSLVGCDYLPLHHNRKGWWSKMELFSLSATQPVLYLDLDTVLVDDCTDIIDAVKGKPFVIIRDFYRGYILTPIDRHAMGSGLMYWEEDMSFLYDAYMQDPDSIEAKYAGDQDFIESVMKTPERIDMVHYWQDLCTGVVSLKADVLGSKLSKTIKGLQPEHKIVCFHGTPRPWQQSLLPYPFRKGMPKCLTK